MTTAAFTFFVAVTLTAVSRGAASLVRKAR